MKLLLANYQVSKEIFGLRVRINSKDKNFFDITNIALSAFQTTDKKIDVGWDLEVSFEGYNKYFATRRSPADKAGYSKLGTDLYISENSVLWETNDYFVKINHSPVLHIDCFYNERIDRTIRADLLFRKDIRFNLYQDILRTIVYFPIFYLLEKQQAKYLLHSAIVEKDGAGLCFIGYNGAGKSSLAYALSKKMDYRMLSDNFAFYDRNCLFAFPDTVRVSKDLLNSLNRNFDNGTVYETNGKLNIINKPQVLRAIPKAFIFCRIGHEKKAKLKQINNIELINKTLGMHDYIKEFHNYSYLSAYEFAFFEERSSHILESKRIQALIDVTSNIPCYEFINNNVMDYEDAMTEVLNELSYQ